MKTTKNQKNLSACLSIAMLSACAGEVMDANGDLPLDEENSSFLSEQSDEASDAYGIADGTYLSLGILRVANELTAAQMKTEMRFNSTLAQQIVSRKPSGGYTTLVQLDGVPNTGAIFFRTIKTYAETKAFVGRCGEGVKQSIEECDDGNLNAGDACSATCKIEIVEADQPLAAKAFAIPESYKNVVTDRDGNMYFTDGQLVTSLNANGQARWTRSATAQMTWSKVVLDARGVLYAAGVLRGVGQFDGIIVGNVGESKFTIAEIDAATGAITRASTTYNASATQHTDIAGWKTGVLFTIDGMSSLEAAVPGPVGQRNLQTTAFSLPTLLAAPGLANGSECNSLANGQTRPFASSIGVRIHTAPDDDLVALTMQQATALARCSYTGSGSTGYVWQHGSLTALQPSWWAGKVTQTTTTSASRLGTLIVADSMRMGLSKYGVSVFARLANDAAATSISAVRRYGVRHYLTFAAINANGIVGQRAITFGQVSADEVGTFHPFVSEDGVTLIGYSNKALLPPGVVGEPTTGYNGLISLHFQTSEDGLDPVGLEQLVNLPNDAFLDDLDVWSSPRGNWFIAGRAQGRLQAIDGSFDLNANGGFVVRLVP